MAFVIKPRQTVLFTGDSITDAGRRAAAAPLGEGYVRMSHDLIAAKYPAHQLRVINTGISGNTARDLHNRWSDDVIRHQPDWLSIMIGINDVHRHLVNSPEAVTPEQFADYYDKILARIKKETKAQIVLIDPFYMSTDHAENSWRQIVLRDIQPYIKTVHAMVRKYRVRHVRMHQMFAEQLKYNLPDRFCMEPVHPNPTGHLMMAHAWLKTMGW